MKVALIGAGRTGRKVLDLHQNTIVFDENNKPTLEKLKECDVVISFLPGDIFLEYIDLLIESKLPVVTGSTGFNWPENISKRLIENKLKWINAHNFSLGMNLVKAMIETLGKANELFDSPEYSIHDIHHVHKLDSPSGTALSWQDWLGHKAEITAERTGDVVGYHHLELKTDVEKIKITHEALDRGIFAKGAIWSANQIINNKDIPHGLTHFSDVVKKQLHI